MQNAWSLGVIYKPTEFTPINFFQVCEQLSEMVLWVQEVNQNWLCVYKKAFLDKMIVTL